jgi:transcriptional regulator
MFSYYRRQKHPTERQITIWTLKRNNLTGKEIAKQIEVDPGFVSRSLKEANKRVRDLLEEAGRMNKIKLKIINGELGIARGHSHIFNISAHITFSPNNGLQVWYEHKGDCTSCEEFSECRRALLQEFTERNIKIPDTTLRPTDLSDLLFKKIEMMLE